MDLGTIIAKEKQYTEKLAELASIDIDAEVERRLADIKSQTEETVKAEIKADTTKCQHYLELLAELKADYIETHRIEEETTEEIDTVQSVVSSEEVL